MIEYLIAELLELAGDNAIAAKKKRIVPVHIAKLIRDDIELGALFKGVTLSRGGVAQFIHPVLTKVTRIKRKVPVVAAFSRGNEDADDTMEITAGDANKAESREDIEE